jgi:hypothetical protein
MSSLEWTTNVYVTSYQAGSEPTTYHELWWVGQDRTAWYNLPAASIRKVRDRVWGLTFPDKNDGTELYFKTLKEAKAMGIALVRMDDGI